MGRAGLEPATDGFSGVERAHSALERVLMNSLGQWGRSLGGLGNTLANTVEHPTEPFVRPTRFSAGWAVRLSPSECPRAPVGPLAFCHRVEPAHPGAARTGVHGLKGVRGHREVEGHRVAGEEGVVAYHRDAGVALPPR